MPAEITATTDMWWVLYPSVVPSEGELADTEFITGAMALHPSGAPVFTSDDLWVVRKPAQLGDGLYTSVERRTYMAQWMQTEFFHHLFRSYPEFELEVNGLDWFDRDNWARCTGVEGRKSAPRTTRSTPLAASSTTQARW